MLYIVGYWHLFNYTEFFPFYSNPVSHKFTQVILGTFCVVSGYLLGFKQNDAVSLITPLKFYKKRFLRIYPLYILSLSCFLFLGLIDFSTAIKAAFLLSMFLEPAPLTLWFISMLLLFYLVTPFLMYFSSNNIKFLAVSMLIELALITYEHQIGSLDIRILIYFPCFAAGLYISMNSIKMPNNNMKAIIIFALCFAVSFIETSWSEHFSFILLAPMVLTGALFILKTRFPIKHTLSLKLITYLSFSSYAMYLFHRPIYDVMLQIYYPNLAFLQWLYLMSVCLPLIVWLSWHIQKTYDTLDTSFRKHYDLT